MKWFYAFLLSLLLVGTVILTACQNSEENLQDDSTSDVGSVIQDSDSIGTIEATLDVPDKTFDSRTFTILTENYSFADFAHEEVGSEAVSEAKYYQSTYVEDAYDVKIEVYQSSSPITTFNNVVATDDDAFQLVIAFNQTMANAVLNGSFAKLTDVSPVDLTKPWWIESINQSISINGETYLALGDIVAEWAITGIHMLYFNKDLLDDVSIDSDEPYRLVNEGEWTMEALKTMTAVLSDDLNGDTEMTLEDDQWGLLQSKIQSSIFFYTGGGHVTATGNDGYPELDLMNNFNESLYSYIFDFDYNQDAIITTADSEEYNNLIRFTNGKAGFLSGFFTFTPELRDSVESFDYGILPYPKYEASQDYISWVTGGNALVGVPINVVEEDYEFVGSVTEALSYYGYKYLRPAVYDTTLKGKLAQDPESIKMIDLIYSSIDCELGWIYTGNEGAAWFVNNLLGIKTLGFNSYYDMNSNRITAHYDKVLSFLKGETASES